MIAAVTLSAATVAHAENTLPPADVATIHQGGGGLPQAYDGTGVTIGFLDYGFDPNHVTFLNRDLSGSRVKAFYLWTMPATTTAHMLPESQQADITGPAGIMTVRV